MEISDIHKQNILFDLIEQGAHEAALELLRGDSLISKDEHNKSLMSACQQGNKLLVQILIENGAEVNYRDTNGNTALLISVQNGFTDIVQFLLTNKADVNASNSVGDSALILSIGSSRPREITENLLKQTGINIDHQNQDGYTAIMKAVEVKDIDSLKILLDKYNNLNDTKNSASFRERIDEQKTPEQLSDSVSEDISKWKLLKQIVNCKGEKVHQIAERCGMGNIFQLLQEHVNTNVSPLELAMREHDINSFRIFLSSYAGKTKKYLDEALKQIFQTCNDKDNSDFSENEVSMIKGLLEHRADVNTNCHGRARGEQDGRHKFEALTTSFHYTRGGMYWNTSVKPIQIVAKIGCLKVLELLLSFQAEVKLYKFKNSPLHIALSYGHIECAKLLIQHGAVIDLDQALDLAVDEQEPKYVKFLIDNYKNYLRRSGDVFTKSLINGCLEIIGYILDLGADINSIIDLNSCPLANSRNGKFAKFLIDRGANVNRVTGKNINTTPLIMILMNRNPANNSVAEVVKVLLENGASANDPACDGLTPLMLAGEKEGSMNVLQLLLDHGAELGEVDKEGNTALMYAAREGCSQNVLFLLQFFKDRKQLLNLQNSEGLTALMDAVTKTNPTVVKELINQGADVNIKDIYGNTALLELLLSGKCENVTQKSPIREGCDVNWQNIQDLSPQTVVGENYFKETVRILLENGACVTDTARDGQTPLMLACTVEGSVSVMQLLLDHGAQFDEVDDDGKTAFVHAVCEGCSQNVAFLLQFIKGRKELLNSQNGEGLTALMYAVRSADPAITKELIDQGVGVNIKDKNGNTALLHLLLSKNKDGEDEIIKFLIEAGCDVNCQNNDGLSPLMVAAQKYFKDTMCVLLDSGAEINAVSNIDDTKTALAHLEYRYFHDKSLLCLECLLGRGASASYLAANTLHKIIADGKIHVVPKLIRSGLGPVDASRREIDFFYNTENETEYCSPLCTALIFKNSSLARFFVENLFLTQSDISSVHHHKLLGQLKRRNWKECFDILNELSTQPLSLYTLSFVAVSTAVGTSPGREMRVNGLPLPELIKDKLLFKSQDKVLTISENEKDYIDDSD